MRLTFIIADCSDAVYGGGEVQRTAHSIVVPDNELPVAVRNFFVAQVRAKVSEKPLYCSISVAIHE